MAWQTPVTNWNLSRSPTKDDLNRIEGNILELNNIVTAGKAAIATSLTTMGQAANSGMTHAQLAAKILDISKEATAAVGDVVLGKTFWQGGALKTGTMQARQPVGTSEIGLTVNAGENITANELVFIDSATARMYKKSLVSPFYRVESGYDYGTTQTSFLSENVALMLTRYASNGSTLTSFIYENGKLKASVTQNLWSGQSRSGQNYVARLSDNRAFVMTAGVSAVATVNTTTGAITVGSTVVPPAYYTCNQIVTVSDNQIVMTWAQQGSPYSGWIQAVTSDGGNNLYYGAAVNFTAENNYGNGNSWFIPIYSGSGYLLYRESNVIKGRYIWLSGNGISLGGTVTTFRSSSNIGNIRGAMIASGVFLCTALDYGTTQAVAMIGSGAGEALTVGTPVVLGSTNNGGYYEIVPLSSTTAFVFNNYVNTKYLATISGTNISLVEEQNKVTVSGPFVPIANSNNLIGFIHGPAVAPIAFRKPDGIAKTSASAGQSITVYKFWGCNMHALIDSNKVLITFVDTMKTVENGLLVSYKGNEVIYPPVLNLTVVKDVPTPSIEVVPQKYKFVNNSYIINPDYLETTLESEQMRLLMNKVDELQQLLDSATSLLIESGVL